MNGKKLAVSFIAILLLVSSAFGSVIYAPKTVQAAGPKINLKALLVTRIADYYSSPYNQQAAENIMRDWGIPFDVTTINSVTALTFWDSVNQVNRYQYVVYFGDVALSTQGNDPTTAVIAIKAAINNGTNFLFVGPSVKAYASLFGLSSLADCPANPQNGGTCGGVLKFGIKHPFSGVLRGDTSWPYGKVLDGTGYSLPDYAMMTSIWNGTGTLFLNATANGVFYPNTIYEKSGPKAASIWSRTTFSLPSRFSVSS